MPCSTSMIVKYDSEDSDYILFDCPYTEAVEGNTYSMTLQMDQKYFTSTSYLTASLPASGMNAKLTYDSTNGGNKVKGILVIVAVGLALLVLILSTASERMIGVEQIQTFQLVLYTMAVMKTCPSTLAPLQKLTYSLLNQDIPTVLTTCRKVMMQGCILLTTRSERSDYSTNFFSITT